MNLITLKELIKKDFRQEYIPQKEFNFLLNNFELKKTPKFLFRGEKIYPETKSNYHRNPISKDEQDYIFNLSTALHKKFIGEININNPYYKMYILEIGAYLQHYGFSIMWLDFTSDVDVALFFSLYKNYTKTARLWIVEVEKMVDCKFELYNLNNSLAKRPVIQKAFALRMYDDKPNFQDINYYPSIKFDFDVMDEDKLFLNNKLLCTKDDIICDFIIEYIQKNEPENLEVRKKMKSIKEEFLSNR